MKLHSALYKVRLAIPNMEAQLALHLAPAAGLMIPLEERTTTPNVEAREVPKMTSKEEVHPGTTVNMTHASHPCRTTDNSECEDSIGNRHSCYTSATAAPQRSVSSAGPSYVSGHSTGISTSLAQTREAADRDCGSEVEVRSDSTASGRSVIGSQQSSKRVIRTSSQDDVSLRSSSTLVEQRPASRTATAESPPLTDTDSVSYTHLTLPTKRIV